MVAQSLSSTARVYSPLALAALARARKIPADRERLLITNALPCSLSGLIAGDPVVVILLLLEDQFVAAPAGFESLVPLRHVDRLLVVVVEQRSGAGTLSSLGVPHTGRTSNRAGVLAESAEIRLCAGDPDGRLPVNLGVVRRAGSPTGVTVVDGRESHA